MMRTLLLGTFAAAALALFGGTTKAADPPLPQMFYYPYHYFPHSYWPAQTPRYPEAKGQPYMRPPAYMQYPAFLEPGWRYELWTPMKYHRGHHFWLDQF